MAPTSAFAAPSVAVVRCRCRCRCRSADLCLPCTALCLRHCPAALPAFLFFTGTLHRRAMQVKFQGECRSCWAFAAAAAVETLWAATTKVVVEISPQAFVDCQRTSGYYGCNGALPVFGQGWGRAATAVQAKCKLRPHGLQAGVVQRSEAWHSTTQHGTAWHSTAQHRDVQRTTARCSMAQHDGNLSGKPCTAAALRPCTLHPAPCTLHPAPCTLHPAPCTLHPAPPPRVQADYDALCKKLKDLSALNGISGLLGW